MFLTSTDSSYSLMELRFSALFSQNLISVIGPGLLPYLRAYSGSNLSTFLIYLVQVMIELSKTCALSLSGVVSEEVSLWDGNGSMVLPLIYPIMT